MNSASLGVRLPRASVGRFCLLRAWPSLPPALDLDPQSGNDDSNPCCGIGGSSGGGEKRLLANQKGKTQGGEAGWQIKGACFFFENPIVKKSAFK